MSSGSHPECIKYKVGNVFINRSQISGKPVEDVADQMGIEELHACLEDVLKNSVMQPH